MSCHYVYVPAFTGCVFYCQVSLMLCQMFELQDSLALHSIAASRIPDIAPTSQQPLNVKVSVSMSRSVSQCQGQCHVCLHDRRGRVVVSISVVHAVVRVRSSDQTSYFGCKNLALNIRDSVSETVYRLIKFQPLGVSLHL